MDLQPVVLSTVLNVSRLCLSAVTLGGRRIELLISTAGDDVLSEEAACVT